MMQIDLDLRKMTERMTAQEALRTALSACGYEGSNLDALHDKLTELNDTLIVLYGARDCDGYARRVLNVVLDSAMENYGLTLRFGL